MEVNSLKETWEGVDAHLYQKVTTTETCGDSSISPTLLHKQENLRTQNPCKTCVVGNTQLVLPVQRRQRQEKPCYLGARSWANSASSMFSEKSCFKKKGGEQIKINTFCWSQNPACTAYICTHTCTYICTHPYTQIGTHTHLHGAYEAEGQLPEGCRGQSWERVEWRQARNHYKKTKMSVQTLAKATFIFILRCKIEHCTWSHSSTLPVTPSPEYFWITTWKHVFCLFS